MEAEIVYALLSVILVSLVSLVGVFTLSLDQHRLKHRLVYLVAFAAGALFGDVFIHLLPEVVEELGFSLDVSLVVLFGIMSMFVVEKIIHWRHCHYPDVDNDDTIDRSHAPHSRAGAHEHHHDHHHIHSFAIVNLIGDAVHNFIDGVVIGGAYLISIPVGIATTLAVVFHEIPQEIGDFGVLLHGGYKVREALTLNLLTALTSVLGALSVFALGSMIEGFSVWIIPFAAGNFLYIAGSDLIPELHKEVNSRVSLAQLIAVLLGIGVMVLLLGLE